MDIEGERFVIDLDYWRVVSKKNTPQANLDAAEEGKTCAERWAALEWLSDCNFSNCGRTDSEHRYFAHSALAVVQKLWDTRHKLRNIPKNYNCLLNAVQDNAGEWINHNPVKNQFLSWRER